MTHQRVCAPEPPSTALVGQSPALCALNAQLHRLAAFDTIGNLYVPTLLLQGETGTGKGLLAHLVHTSGPRRHGPFIDVNCAAIPETLLEAELFGFEAGAFTDARRAKPGLLESAAGGILFLDEIDTLPLSLQAKLLKVMEEKRVRRLGAVAERRVDVKLIVATREDLATCVRAGRFRADLYHRLAVVMLELPPLRARGADIVLLAQHFLQQYATAHGLRPKRLSAAAAGWLQQYGWPGNVRELSHLMERATLLHPEELLDTSTLAQLCLPQLPPAPRPASGSAAAEPVPLDDEPARIRQALLRTGGNVVRASRLLGLSRSALRYRIQRYGIAALGREEPEQPAPTLEADDALTPAAPQAQAAGWEHKPIAVLAIAVTFPTDQGGQMGRSDPWAEAANWEHKLMDKVRGFGGVVLQRSPSLLLVGFGVPRALEQMPLRAVQAALAIRHLTARAATTVAGALGPVVRLVVHLGVVMVDAGARDPTARLLAVGETLALPVQLLGHARPGEVLVSSHVARRVAGLYEIHMRALPLRSAQGDRLEVSVVVGLRPRHGPLAQREARALSRFVGRERDLAALQEVLAQVEGGQGQVVGIVGEPGIGKSRFVYEFHRSLQGRRLTYLTGRCFASGSTTPYLPILDILRHNCGITDADDAAAMTTKVGQSLQEVGLSPADWAPYLLHLLGVQGAGDGLATLSPQALKARTFETLLQMSLRGSQRRPLILEVEDAHWIDATSEEFCAALVERLAGVPLLLLVTYRPGYRPSWIDKSYAAQRALLGLRPRDSRQVVRAILHAATVSETLVQLVLRKADGNPFFLEELTRAIGEHGGGTIPAVPDTIQEVLAARIDRLPPEAKRLLQVAAVIGKDLPYALLQALMELPEKALHRNLRHLQEAEFLYETQLFPDHAYTFKHALTQEVAYQSLPECARRQVHQRLAQALVERLPEVAEAQPEWVAHHYTEAGLGEQAVVYWQRAGRRAYERSANVEAISHLTRGLAMLAVLPDTPERTRHELLLHATLGPVLMAAKGYAAPEVEQTWGRARELCQRLGDTHQLFPVLVGLWNFYFVRGATQTACDVGEQLLILAQQAHDPRRLLRAHAAVGEIWFHAGRIVPAHTHLEQGIALYDPGKHHSHAVQVPTVACLAYAAWALWHLGYADQALVRSQAACALAQEISHPLSLAIALLFQATVHQFRREIPAAYELAEAAWVIAHEQGFPFWEASSMIQRGWALAMRDAHDDEGIRQIQQGLVTFRATGAEVQLPSWLALLAEAYGHHGQVDQGLQAVHEGLAVLARTGERYYEAELYRFKGELLVQQGAGQQVKAKRHTWWEAEASLRQALDVARQQQAKSPELRAAINLSRLWQQQGKHTAARQLLADAYGWFTEGDDTADSYKRRKLCWSR